MTVDFASVPTKLALARLKEGVDLIRIGKPMRPEMAAWRYGDQFGRATQPAAVDLNGGVSGARSALWAV